MKGSTVRLAVGILYTVVSFFWATQLAPMGHAYLSMRGIAGNASNFHPSKYLRMEAFSVHPVAAFVYCTLTLALIGVAAFTAYHYSRQRVIWLVLAGINGYAMITYLLVGVLP
jgi:hypothetical protein